MCLAAAAGKAEARCAVAVVKGRKVDASDKSVGAELSLLLYRKDAGKALTRGAEAQMPAREDAVEATDRKDAGKALSRKDLAELMHMSRGDLRAALQKLVSRGMLEVVRLF